ncbi:FAD-dependent monooxygenase [Frondihabitans cladoniiphilus]|uniref:FAD-dependent monooxygenase n=1 Tax=Frondihabitans cladoniiphilus TaxID=715785 RepID=A0ABP8VV01_9MICO
MTETATHQSNHVLISGASFAGLTTAIWMHRLGYRVTIVENAPGLRKGGTPVDLKGDALRILDRMGILPAVRAKALPPRTTEFAEIDGTPITRTEPEPEPELELELEPESELANGAVVIDGHEVHGDEDVEIHRDDLLAILFDEAQGDIEIVFGDSVTELTDTRDGVRAAFRNGPAREFAMVLGCDGNHSTVRRLWFGPEADYSHFLRHYTSVTIIDGMVLAPWTTRLQNAPGRTLLLNSYEDTTDVVFVFRSEEEIPYDRHDVDEQKRIIRDRFADAGLPFTDVLEQALTADNFYFDKLSQNRLPAWSSGRVALVGDAAYCPSPAAGMGGSVAILGATALYDAFRAVGGDMARAFAAYERSFRPTAEQIQLEAEQFSIPMMFPDTAEAIAARNALLREG